MIDFLKNHAKGFEVIFSSDSKYERLIALIKYNGKFCASVIEERGPGMFDIETVGTMPVEDLVSRRFDLEGFVDAVQRAKEGLKRTEK